MAENNLTVPLEELNDENEMILNDLELSQKRIEFLQNYRKVLIELSVKCICNQNKPLIKSIESLETQFHQLFSEYNDNKSEDIIEIIDERSEDNNDFEVIDEEDDSQEKIDLKLFSEFNGIKSVETTIENSEKKSDFEIEDSEDDNLRKISEELDINDSKSVQQNSKTMSTPVSSQTCIVDNRSAVNNIKVTVYNIKTNIFDAINKAFDSNGDNSRTESMTQMKRYSEPKPSKVIIFRSNAKNSPLLQTNDNKTKQISSGQTSSALKIMESLTVPKPLGKQLLIKVIPQNLKEKNSEVIAVSKSRQRTDNQIETIAESYSNGRTAEPKKSIIISDSQLGESTKCHLCGKQFGSKRKLGKHSINVHNSSNRPVIRCKYPDCNYQTHLISNFQIHFVRHQKECPIKCNECDKRFKTTYSHNAHKLLVHSNGKPFPCDWPGCEYKAITQNCLNRHQNNHNKVKQDKKKVERLKSVNCSSYIHMETLRKVLESGNHVMTNEGNTKYSVIHKLLDKESDGKTQMGQKLGFKCNYTDCLFINTKFDLMTDHLRTHLMGNTYECDLCHKKFSFRKYLIQHKKCSHNSKNQPVVHCSHPGCNYQTHWRAALKKHSVAHQEERPFQCDQKGCDKRFKLIRGLSEHKLFFHSNVKPYQCDWPGCEYRTKFKQAIRSHKFYVHNVEYVNNKPFMSCEWPGCDHKAINEGRLREHLSSHSDDRPFKCDEKGCDKRYNLKKHLKIHKLSAHSEERPFACDWPGCEYRCKIKHNLGYHMKVHLKSDLKHRCDYCLKSFKFKTLLTKHIKEQH